MNTCPAKQSSRLIASLFLLAIPALSAPIAITGSSAVTLDFNGFYGSSSGVIPGLSGMVSLSNFTFTNTTFENQAATVVGMNYLITNDSTQPVLTSRITGFAFDTTPNILIGAPNFVNGVFDTLLFAANQPNGVGTLEACWSPAGCPGGGGGGVALGNTAGGTATLYFAGSVSSFTIDNAFLRYQSVTCSNGSNCNASASGSLTGGGNDAPVPEPSTYLLMSLGIAGVVVAARRVRRS